MEPRTTRKAATTPMFAGYRLLYTITTSLTVFLIIIALHLPTIADSTTDNSVFQYTRGPVPDNFQVGQHYPARSEMEECRPIRLRIGRDSRLFRTSLVVNSNPGIHFASSDAKRMTSRLQSRLNSLASLFYSRYQLRLTVHLAWVEYSPDDGVDDPQSLHYEGECGALYLHSSSVFLPMSMICESWWLHCRGGACYLGYELESYPLNSRTGGH